jgi:hypothetical protein
MRRPEGCARERCSSGPALTAPPPLHPVLLAAVTWKFRLDSLSFRERHEVFGRRMHTKNDPRRTHKRAQHNSLHARSCIACTTAHVHKRTRTHNNTCIQRTAAHAHVPASDLDSTQALRGPASRGRSGRDACGGCREVDRHDRRLIKGCGRRRHREHRGKNSSNHTASHFMKWHRLSLHKVSVSGA